MIFFEFARRNIRLNLLRSLLAVIGIVIGVVAISSMGILGNSLVLSISESLTTVGDTIVVTLHTGGGGPTGTSSKPGITYLSPCLTLPSASLIVTPDSNFVVSEESAGAVLPACLIANSSLAPWTQ